MSVLSSLLTNTTNIIIVSIGILLIISLIWNLIISVQLSKLNKKYKKFMRGNSGKNFETMVFEQIENMENALKQVENMDVKLDNQKEQLDKCIQKCDIIRYNAFKDTGSDLSFSIAFLDNTNNGVILTGIYGRNESFTYAKPIENGASKYPLSVEEDLVLDRCLKKAIK